MDSINFFFLEKLSQKKKAKFEIYKNSSLCKDEDIFSDEEIPDAVISPFHSKELFNNNNLQVVYDFDVYCSN